MAKKRRRKKKTWHLVKSSHVFGLHYNERTRTLAVKFTNNTVYHYFDVPYDVYCLLIQAESVGSILNMRVKGKYKYAKIS